MCGLDRLIRHLSRTILTMVRTGEEKGFWSGLVSGVRLSRNGGVCWASAMNFSVIMAAWNVGPYVGDALRSVLAQEHPLLEVIVIDDGSTDDTLARVREVASGDARVRVMRRENGGFAAAANQALLEVRGDWVAIADSDDVQLPQRLTHLAEAVRRDPKVTVCGGGVETWHGGTDRPHPSLMPERDAGIRAGMLFESMLFHPTVIYRADLMPADRAVYDTGFRMAMDYDLWCRWMPRARFHNVPLVLTRYRQRPDQLTETARNSGVRDAERYRIWDRELTNLLGIKARREELELHRALAMWRDDWRSGQLSAVELWMQRIRGANRERQVLDGGALGVDLGRRWFWAFRHAQGLRMSDVARYFRSSLAWNRAVPLRSKLGLLGRVGREI